MQKHKKWKQIIADIVQSENERIKIAQTFFSKIKWQMLKYMRKNFFLI